MSTPKETACDRVLAHYRERAGKHWTGADEILFRAAWNEGAHERGEQLRAEVEEASWMRHVLGLIGAYADTYGAALVPHGPDTYGEGIRTAKRAIKDLLARAGAKKETTR